MSWSPKVKMAVAAAILLGGGFLAYRGVRSLGQSLGLWRKPHAQGPAMNFGPYPVPEPAGEDPHWNDPKKIQARAEKAAKGTAARALRQEAWKQAEADPAKALDVLFEKRRDPEAAQALFESLRELASQGKEAVLSGKIAPGKGEEAPVMAAPHGTAIQAVARVAERLAKVKGTPEQGRFDGTLLEDSIRLMGVYGVAAPSAAKPGEPETIQADPVVKGVLRGVLLHSDKSIQALASRALGELRDGETARDIMRNPHKYPGASISDFGPEAVQAYKEMRGKQLAKGQGNDALFWQGVRLRPKDQEVALELAGKGDGGALLAAQRNDVVESLQLKISRDEWIFQKLDRAIRFPNTPQALPLLQLVFDPQSRCTWLEILAEDQAPLTLQAIFTLLNRDLAIVFSGKPFRKEDLGILQTSFLVYALHPHQMAAKNGMWWDTSQFGDPNSPQAATTRKSLATFRAMLLSTFQKQYRRVKYDWLPNPINPNDPDEMRDVRVGRIGISQPEMILLDVNMALHHLGLPRLQWPNKHYLLMETEGTKETGGWAYSCLKHGCIKSSQELE